MKILQIINSMETGGAEKLLLESLPFYNKPGIKMDILVLNGGDYPFMKELKALNCCTIYSLGEKSVYNPLHIFQIIPYLKKYEIVHVHLFPAQYWVILAKLISFSKTKLVFTEHSTSNRRIQSSWLKYIDRFIYKKYHKIVCITPKVFDVIKMHTKLSEKNLQIILNGVNVSKYRNAEPLPKADFFPEFNENEKFVIQVSSYHPPKDQQTLIRAISLLPENIKLLLAGDGVTRKDCELLVASLELEKRVFFLGLRMDIPNLLKNVDIVVLSSRYEGLSLSSIEGMASGKPFIASDVPGLSEIVGGAGLLFQVGNEKELAENIAKLLSDKEYYSSIVESCQKRAEEFDIQSMVNKHINLYNSILN
ncbi:glycosyltransferase [uncultured Flavobacterium sp.]|uniref:glycosyltransferase n=1 Tax=uncultured Flavobacterium sp. TaxID=165435 RepID=UPI0025FFBB3C|nr:glycosyltransferase [uncultured Flavobacterium sp.]